MLTAHKDVEFLSKNVIAVRHGVADSSSPLRILDKTCFADTGKKPKERLYRYFRDGIYIADLPGMLEPEDVLALNARCDQSEGGKNRAVKNVVATTLATAFHDQAFRLTELGCGAYPILSYFPQANVTYHGVELDQDHVNHLKTRLNLSASDWTGVPPLPGDKPSLCVSIYALHFMIKRDLPEKIGAMISKDGVFVANMYLDPEEIKTRKQSTYLDKLLRGANMEFRRVTDKGERSNEYYVIGHAGSGKLLDSVASTLSVAAAHERSRSRPHDHDRGAPPQRTH